MKQQVHVYYSGRVQGVGFRYTAVDLAESLGITGWVRNLSDGRVEILAEAQEDDLKIFLDRIRDGFSVYIRNTQIDWKPAIGEFSDFTITN
ncbi:MAG: acylphosphatase [Candidatus Omnitrophica bacterium]|nr:acylphosphatase [Candidatus Omnitrophota bacterium]